MIEPGLFRHYKGKLYRVLFVALWNDDGAPEADGVVIVETDTDGSPLVELRAEIPLLSARWSGNNTRVALNDEIVIYVALYDNGRIAARPLKEFEEHTFVDGFRSKGVPRFERIGA